MHQTSLHDSTSAITWPVPITLRLVCQHQQCSAGREASRCWQQACMVPKHGRQSVRYVQRAQTSPAPCVQGCAGHSNNPVGCGQTGSSHKQVSTSLQQHLPALWGVQHDLYPHRACVPGHLVLLYRFSTHQCVLLCCCANPAPIQPEACSNKEVQQACVESQHDSCHVEPVPGHLAAMSP
jgi:hypothetical protein